MPDTPFWQSGIRFQCQQSGKCCTSRGSYGYIYVDESDAKRFAAYFGLGVGEFLERYCDNTDGWWHLKDPSADCSFLEGKACGVYEARPEQCRTWPFWPENMRDLRTWTSEVAEFCPGVGQGDVVLGPQIAEILRQSHD